MKVRQLKQTSQAVRWRILRSVPALTWMALIFYASSQPALPIDGQPHSAAYHQLGHVVAYAVLAILVRYAVAGLPASGWLALAITVVYGISDEVHQTFVPNRSGTVRDLLIDSTAASVALGMLALWRRQRSARALAGTSGGMPRPGSG